MFTIQADYTLESDWMAFALWYSIKRYLPDAKIFILLPKKPFKQILFKWLDKCKVRRLTSGHEGLLLPDHCIMIREPLDYCIKDEMIQDINSDGSPVFIKFGNKIGNLDIAEWATKTKIAPFNFTWQCETKHEQAVAQLWRLMSQHYQLANR